MEARKPNYMDSLRGEFCQMCVNYGVDPAIANELAVYLAGKVMSSWKNGMSAGFKKASAPKVLPQPVAA